MLGQSCFLICNVQITIVHRGNNPEDANISPYINTVENNRKGNTGEKKNHHNDISNIIGIISKGKKS